MTIVEIEKEPSDAGAHPAWCARMPDCTGKWHRSREVVVPGDEIAGVGVRLAIIGHAERAFCELMMRPASSWTPGQAAGEDADTNRALDVQDDEDPMYITDPHAHDLTMEQAATLYDMLGELLALTRSHA